MRCLSFVPTLVQISVIVIEIDALILQTFIWWRHTNQFRFRLLDMWSSSGSMPLDQNVKTTVLRISSEVAAWRNSTSWRSADEVDAWWSICRLQHVGEARRAATVVYCTSSSTACIQFLSEPEVSAARADGEWCVRDMERRRWAVRRRSGLYEVAGVSTGEDPPTPSCSSLDMMTASTKRMVMSFPTRRRTWHSQRKWKKQMLATFATCCFMDNSESRWTLRFRTTSTNMTVSAPMTIAVLWLHLVQAGPRRYPDGLRLVGI